MSSSWLARRAWGPSGSAARLSALVGVLLLTAAGPAAATKAQPLLWAQSKSKHSPVIWTTTRELMLSTIDGKQSSLLAHSKPVTLLFLWAVYCEPCLVELPYVDALFRRFRADPDVAILSINEDFVDMPKALIPIQAALAPYKLEVPVLLDSRRQTEGLVTRVLGSQTVPLPLVVILRNGRAVKTRPGFDITMREEDFVEKYAAMIEKARAGVSDEELFPAGPAAVAAQRPRTELSLPWVKKDRIDQQAPQVRKFLALYFPGLSVEQRQAMFDETHKAVLRGEPAIFRAPSAAGSPMAAPPPAR